MKMLKKMARVFVVVVLLMEVAFNGRSQLLRVR